MNALYNIDVGSHRLTWIKNRETSLFLFVVVITLCVCVKKTWWDCVKSDMESLGLSQNDDREGELKGQPANPG